MKIPSRLKNSFLKSHFYLIITHGSNKRLLWEKVSILNCLISFCKDCIFWPVDVFFLLSFFPFYFILFFWCRYAVVTGANRGIGFEISRGLASHGITVVLTARDEKRGLEAVKKLKECGYSDDNLFFHQLDVSNLSSISSLTEFVNSQFGRLDILVSLEKLHLSFFVLQLILPSTL